MNAPGRLAIVLHTHMPYVEGFGTWPFGEEWLWEAIACCYVPLLALLDAGAPLTLSLTPVLCDQLEVPDLLERFERFVLEVRRETHARDAAGLREAGESRLAEELERSYSDYERALQVLRKRDGDLLGAFAPHAGWTSSATHAVLPLLATDAAVHLQLACGIASHRRRFGRWEGGFWLPECAWAPSLEAPLEQAGARSVCVELTSRLGLGSRSHLAPRATAAGLTLVPVDRATMALVWGEQGYPSAGAYRDYHHHTVHHHNPWANDGSAYDHAAALTLARSHAADFVRRVRTRLSDGAARPGALPGGGLVVCALDTELLGHWWYEGVEWLRSVVQECERQGLELVRLDDALSDMDRVPAGPESAGWPTSWGEQRDLSTWSGPAVAQMAFAVRAAELRTLAAGAAAGPSAVRALLGAQASDWTFMVSREISAPYARERLRGHLEGVARALALGAGAPEEGLRNLAVDARPGDLLAPL